MSNTVGLIFVCVLMHHGNTQINGNNICELGDSCAAFLPDCTIDCDTDVTNVNDPSTLACLESLFDGMSDINTCCIPSIKGRPINGVIPPNCFNVTAPFDQSERLLNYYEFSYEIYKYGMIIYRMLCHKYWM